MGDHADAPIVATQEGALWRLRLNRPERGNALGPAMVERLEAELDAAIRDGARLVLLEGAGRNFCTGFDLSGLEELSDADLLQRFVCVELLLQRFYRAPVMTCAVGAGRTTGAGADLFVACGRRLAVTGARFAFPGSGFGLVLGTSRLTARVGEDTARRILLGGEEVDAEAAGRCGLATEVAAPERVEAAVAAALRAATRLDPVTVAALHRGTRHGGGDAALAALVRSAARPGLRDRILRYRDGLKRG